MKINIRVVFAWNGGILSMNREDRFATIVELLRRDYFVKNSQLC